MRHLDADNLRRKEIAARYEREISSDLVKIRLSGSENTAWDSIEPRDSVHHIFPVFCERRDELQAFLSANGIETQIHYPIPPHQQRCYQGSFGQSPLPRTERIHASELSIPCHQAMTNDEVTTVIRLLNQYSE